MCHQTVSLVARYIEAAGIPTVIMGCARDIVEHAGVPRFHYSEFPLGNSAGKPDDEASQWDTVTGALALFDAATAARTTVVSPQTWADSDDWQRDFMNVDAMSEDEVQRRKREFAAQKHVANRLKSGTAAG